MYFYILSPYGGINGIKFYVDAQTLMGAELYSRQGNCLIKESHNEENTRKWREVYSEIELQDVCCKVITLYIFL